jgi:hypothetical protein
MVDYFVGKESKTQGLLKRYTVKTDKLLHEKSVVQRRGYKLIREYLDYAKTGKI